MDNNEQPNENAETERQAEEKQGDDKEEEGPAKEPLTSNAGGGEESNPAMTTSTTPTAENTTATRPTATVLPLDWTQLGGNPEDSPPIRYPSDVAEIDPADDYVMVVGTAGQKITHLGKHFSREVHPQLKELVFRSHLVSKMEGLEGLRQLTVLELYDNQIEELECLEDPGPTLRTLDMSYNVIRSMAPVQLCPNLTELYLANNKLKTIEGLEGLTQLRKIDLGANRIRIMEGLSTLVNLEELWIGKNKIEQIEGLENLTKLRRLDVQSNRLTRISGLTGQRDTLEELYLAHNGINDDGLDDETGLQQPFAELNVLDLGRNCIATPNKLSHLTKLEELWISGNSVEAWDALRDLSAVSSLDTIYLEYNPIQKNDPLYRKTLAELVPSLKRIDADIISAAARAAMGMPPAPAPKVALESETERLRRLQDMAFQRAQQINSASNPPAMEGEEKE